ncbi:MAG: modulator of FtsH protease [Candidatus Endobugula sp.]|jgi:modulator of FtsH protease
MQDIYNSQTAAPSASLETAKVLRNTYALLSMTLLFSAVTAGITMSLGLGRGAGFVMMIGAMALIWFVLPRTANSGAGIVTVFAFTGLLGGSLGPILNHYLAMANGGSLIMQALGGTALVFFSLSAYVLTKRKDFSFMGGFLFIGLIVAIVATIGMIVAAMLGYEVSIFSAAISAVMVLLMSGFILYDTSRIINGGETNYLHATTQLYLDIYLLFSHLLSLLGFLSDD